MQDLVEYPGDPHHPNHTEWLLELGRASYVATRVAGISFDILRVFGEHISESLYEDPLGGLEAKLRKLHKQESTLPGMEEFLISLEKARITRNDLLHALPTKNGLLRRLKSDPTYLREFYDILDLVKAKNEMTEAWHIGSRLLYHDGGAAVASWANRPKH